MIVNAAAVDFLTLTSWNDRVMKRFEACLETHAIEPMREIRRMQYRGTIANNVFVGWGEQGGHRHHMLQASGMDADIVAPMLLDLPAKCTRIDLQVTVKLPKEFSPSYDAQKLRRWDGPGRSRKVTYMQSGDGFDTIYIGSRSSRRYIRLYVKPDHEGVPHLRFEIEYKRELAESLWEELRMGASPDILRGALLHEVLQVPNMMHVVGPEMMTVLHGEPHAPQEERKPSNNQTVEWLARQVEPAILRAMADHDTGSLVRDMVRAWAAEADSLDDLTNLLDIV